MALKKDVLLLRFLAYVLLFVLSFNVLRIAIFGYGHAQNVFVFISSNFRWSGAASAQSAWRCS